MYAKNLLEMVFCAGGQVEVIVLIGLAFKKLQHQEITNAHNSLLDVYTMEQDVSLQR